MDFVQTKKEKKWSVGVFFISSSPGNLFVAFFFSKVDAHTIYLWLIFSYRLTQSIDSD